MLYYDLKLALQALFTQESRQAFTVEQIIHRLYYLFDRPIIEADVREQLNRLSGYNGPLRYLGRGAVKGTDTYVYIPVTEPTN